MSLDRLGSGEALAAGFLSIDMDALLRKLPARSFRSPHHWPVELVRSALGRGARRVDVRIGTSRVEIVDDGPPIAREEMDRLAIVFDTSMPPAARQEALASFEAPGGMGVLAAFAPSPREVRIQTGGRREVAVFRPPRPPAVVTEEKRPGTRITVLRRDGKATREREILEDYCRHATADVLLEGRLVSRRSGASEGIHEAPLPPVGAVLHGTVWIPLTGDVCRTRLLDHGIRREQVVDPSGGLVYEAAVECPGDPPPELASHASGIALDLYRRLPRTYEAHPRLRTRIEELLFLHFRRTGSTLLVDGFSPFATLGGDRIDLPAIRARAREGPVEALRSDDDPALYAAGPRTLVLTQAQWEFVSEHVRIPLTPPLPRPAPDPWTARLGRWLVRRLAGAASLLVPARPVPDEDLSPAERRLVMAISAELLSGRYVLDGSRSTRTMVVMSRHSGRHPGRLVELRGRSVLAVSRRHPLVARASASLDRDPSIIRLVLPVLTRGAGAWKS